MKTIPWSPPDISTDLAAVSVPPGPLTEQDWWEALADRVSALVWKEPDPEEAASMAARVLQTPGVENPRWAGESLVLHNLELRNAMCLQIRAEKDPFPARVVVANREARRALKETTLDAWLDLAAARVSTSNLE